MGSDRIGFTGADSIGSLATKYIFAPVQTNKIIEYSAVDAVSMIIPRTCIDYSRNEDAGKETGRREVSSCVTECFAPGLLAAGAGYMMGKVYKNGIKTHNALPIDGKTIDAMNKAWEAANKGQEKHYWKATPENQKKILQNYTEYTLNRTGGLVVEKWMPLCEAKEEKCENSLKAIASDIVDLIHQEKKPSGKQEKAVIEKIVNLLGASENLKIITNTDNDKINADILKTGEHIETTAQRLVEGIIGAGRGVFVPAESTEKLSEAVEKFKNIGVAKSGLVMFSIAALGFSQQYINRYLTKKKTGNAGFVGLSMENRKAEIEEQKNDKKAKFKLYAYKAMSLAALTGIASAAIAGSLKPKVIVNEVFNIKNMIHKMEFKSMWPSTNQLRILYASIIAGRMLAATDKHELRETDTRDIPGFLNWLVIGGFVSKLVGHKISGGKIMNGAKPPEGASWFEKAKHIIGKNVLETHAEIEAKVKKGFIKTSEERKLHIRNLNISIGAGLLYSTLALGVFMPFFNKYLTNKLVAKKNQPQPHNNPSVKIENSKPALNITSENEAFSDFVMIQKSLHKTV